MINLSIRFRVKVRILVTVRVGVRGRMRVRDGPTAVDGHGAGLDDGMEMEMARRFGMGDGDKRAPVLHVTNQFWSCGLASVRISVCVD